MGVSLSWIGVKGTTAHDLHTRLGLSETGATGRYYDFPMAGLMLPSRWYLLLAKGCDHRIRSDQIVSALSDGTSVLACSIEEHVMHQSAVLWSNGQQVWSVRHRGGDCGIMDLVVSGTPPDSFEDLRSHYYARQVAEGGTNADVDYIADIPLELAGSLVGFKHDEINSGIDDGSFRALRQQPSGLLSEAPAPRWKFWQQRDR